MWSVAGALNLAIEGPGRVFLNCDDNKKGLCRITYTAEVAGLYNVNVKFDGQHIVGSPFKAVMEGMCVNMSSCLLLKM